MKLNNKVCLSHIFAECYRAFCQTAVISEGESFCAVFVLVCGTIRAYQRAWPEERWVGSSLATSCGHM